MRETKKRMMRETKKTMKKKKRESKSIEKLLPEDIQIDIISRLPTESVLSCKQVCKTWLRLLRVTEFVNMHLHRQLLLQQLDYYPKDRGGDGCDLSKVSLLCLRERKDLNSRLMYDGEYDDDLFGTYNGNDYIVVGSCNGLIYFTMQHDCERKFVKNDPVYICNPIVGEEVKLPRFVYERKSVRLGYGFGYLPSTNEYKVVRVSFYPERDSNGKLFNVGQVEVYTLGDGNGWRNKGEISYIFCRHDISEPPIGVFADGSLHWLDHKKFVIVAFDLTKEEFHVVPSPPCLRPINDRYLHRLRMFGGCLCVVHKKRGKRMDIWLLMKKNNTTSNEKNEQENNCCWSWSMEFSIPWVGEYNDDHEPVALTETGRVLLWYDQITPESPESPDDKSVGFITTTMLSLYNPKTSKVKRLVDSGFVKNPLRAIPHIDSFVSLKALGETLNIW